MKNYQEIFDLAFEVYGNGEYWKDSFEASYQVLNKLTKKELLEMNDQLDLTCLSSSYSKSKCIDTIVEMAIQWHYDAEALGRICLEVRSEYNSIMFNM